MESIPKDGESSKDYFGIFLWSLLKRLTKYFLKKIFMKNTIEKWSILF